MNHRAGSRECLSVDDAKARLAHEFPATIVVDLAKLSRATITQPEALGFRGKWAIDNLNAEGTVTAPADRARIIFAVVGDHIVVTVVAD